MTGTLALPPNIQSTNEVASKTFKGSQGSGNMVLRLTNMSGDINLKFSGGNTTPQTPASPAPQKNVVTKDSPAPTISKPTDTTTPKSVSQIKPQQDTATIQPQSAASAGGRGSSGFASSSGGNSQACVGDKCIVCVNNKCTFEGKSIPPNSSISCKNGQCTVLGPGENIIPADMNHPIPSGVADVGSSGSPTDEVSKSCAGDMCITCSNGGCTITKNGTVISQTGNN
jgi:hypothetical protein